MRKSILLCAFLLPLTAHAADNKTLSCSGTIAESQKPIIFKIDRDAQEISFTEPRKYSLGGIVEARYYKNLTRVKVLRNEEMKEGDYLTLFVERANGKLSGMMWQDSGDLYQFNGFCDKEGFAF